MAKPDLKTYRDRMDRSVAALKEEFSGLRTGRANAGLLEPVRVEAYGSASPLTAVAAISVPEPRMITVSVWDKGMVVSVEKAIRAAGLGLNPIVDGQTLRLPIPDLTEERRPGGRIEIDDEKVLVPGYAVFSVEHEREGGEQRDEDRNRDGDAELQEEPADDAAHEGDGKEHGDDAQGRRYDGEADLVGVDL